MNLFNITRKKQQNKEINQKINDEQEQRQQLRKTRKTAMNKDIKQKLSREIRQSQIDQKQAEIKKIQNTIQEQYYSAVLDTVNFYKSIDLCRSAREFSVRLNKSPCYVAASKKQNHQPSLDFIKDIQEDINFLDENKKLLAKYHDLTMVKKQCESLTERFNNLKNQIIRL